jgi:hypothetical protein
MRKLTLLTLLVAAGVIAIAATTSGVFVIAKAPLSVHSPAQPKHVIDGAVNPELIPDRQAYLMLFRLLANRHSEAERKSIWAYIDGMNLGGPDKLLAVADDFERRIGELDSKAQQIHEQSASNLDAQAIAQLNSLQGQKEKIVDELIASLPNRLGADGAEKCRQHITERVKRRMKYSE